MGGEGEAVATRGESDRVHPSGRVVQELAADSVERKPVAPDSRLWALVNALDVAREHAGVGIRRASSEEHRVRGQSTLVMVLRMGFFRCFDTHQSFSSSK